jgi:hypothetical protein
MYAMRRAGIVALAALAGCGSGGIEGTLQWQGNPVVHSSGGSAGATAAGTIRNTTSHSVTLAARQMRLLDDRGTKVAGRVRVGSSELAAGASTRLVARWKSGKPVRIDYGAGTLALPSP